MLSIDSIYKVGIAGSVFCEYPMSIILKLLSKECEQAAEDAANMHRSNKVSP